MAPYRESDDEEQEGAQERDTIKVRIDGEVVGELDPYTLTAADQIRLERAVGLAGVFDWLEQHAGADPEHLMQIAERITLSDQITIATGIVRALSEAARLPKANGGASSATPTPRTPRGRPRGSSAATSPSAGTSPRGSSRPRRH